MSMPSPSPALAPGGGVRLPTPPGIIRRFWSRHPYLADTLIALIYFVPVTLNLVYNLFNTQPTSPAHILLNSGITVLLTAALFFRRRMPRLVLAITWVGLLGITDYGDAHLVAQLLALYAVAVYVNVRTAWFGFGASTVVVSLALWQSSDPANTPWLPVAITMSIMMLAATLIGINVGNSKRYVTSLLDLAAQLARERDQQAQLSRISERSRIAAEMHDVVAHGLSVMVALADGAHAIAPKDTTRARAAMSEVALTGRQSMTEMRRLLGVLDNGHERAVRTPQPGSDQLVELVETFRSTGLPVVLERSGPDPANSNVQLTIYRLVQESLTNVLRYADTPTTVMVRIVSSPTRVEVIVSDDGRVQPAANTPVHGRGLIGMNERVALYGGTLIAQAGDHGGWRVHATMNFEHETGRELTEGNE